MTINPASTSVAVPVPPTPKPDRAEFHALLKDLITSAQKGDTAQAKADADKLSVYLSKEKARAGVRPPFYDFINKLVDAAKSGDADKLKAAYASGIKDFRDDTGITAKNDARKAAFLAERQAEIASGAKDADDGKKSSVNASGLPSAVNISV